MLFYINKTLSRFFKFEWLITVLLTSQRLLANSVRDLYFEEQDSLDFFQEYFL